MREAGADKVQMENDTSQRKIEYTINGYVYIHHSGRPMTAKLPSPSPKARSQDHIFVSYSTKDRAFVDQLATELRKHGHIVWIDFEGIRGGDQWKQSIADGLHPSRIVLLVISPDSIVSEWVEAEIETARSLNKKILPLLLRPIGSAGSIAFPNLRYVVEEIQHRDFTKGFQQPFVELLKDLPKPKSGVAGHCQKLAARLAAASWGLDHYIQEEAKLLPLNASPYENGVVTGQAENLLKRLSNSQRIIVLGEPGVGKSVALERLAWEQATLDKPVVPIIIKLLEYDGKPLLEWIHLKLVELGEIKHPSLQETENFLNDPDYACYFLLDGLNEVRPAHRDTLTGEITRLALRYPHHQLAVTSRVQDESWRVLRQGSAIQETVLVQTIRFEQAQRYLEAHLETGDSERLWTGLDERMKELATTPLLLWLIKEAWLEAKQRGGDNIHIPDNRGELYHNFVIRMLRRDNDRRLTERASEPKRLEALERLALAMHEAKVLTIPLTEALAILGDEPILTTLMVNGLLLGENELRFAPHQTLQEHFAARALAPKVPVGGVKKVMNRFESSPHVLEHADDPWWAETFIQLAGLTNDPNVLAQTIAQVNPWLAWWCAEEGRQIDHKTREFIRNRSIALVYSDQVSDRRSAAQALVRLQTPRVIEPLIILAVDKNDEVGQIAIQGLIALGNTAIPTILRRIDISETIPIGRHRLGRVLADIGDPRPGTGLKNGLPDIEWVDIPAGAFLMGSDDRGEDEKPQHKITLSAYRISRYPITYQQFQAFLDADDGFRNPDWGEGLAAEDEHKKQPGEQAFKVWNHPREDVSWLDAVAFCRWLSAKVGYEVRLPTETEWEKAARGESGLIYPYGNEYDSAKANTSDTGIGQTSAVGLFPNGASPYGVMDMSGNVWELCSSQYKSYPFDGADGREDLGGTSARVVRGGSWAYIQGSTRAAFRRNYLPTDRNNIIGFRVVCSSPSA